MHGVYPLDEDALGRIAGMHVWSDRYLPDGRRGRAAARAGRARLGRAGAGAPTGERPALPADDDLLPALTDSAFALLVERLEEALRGPVAARPDGESSARERVRSISNVIRPGEAALPSETLTIVDNRTGREYSLPIVDGAIRATDLAKISAADGDGGLLSYDPAYLNTSSCRSAITYIDGDVGHPALPRLPDRAGRRAGELPRDRLPAARGRAADARRSSTTWEEDVRNHTYVHTNVTKFLEGFRYDAHPMGMLLGAVGALSTFYPDAKDIADPANRYLQRVRLIAKIPTIAAFAFRHSRGLPYVFPRNDLGYIGNFVNMTFEIGGRHEPNPVLQRALEILLILHADHEQNCSTSAVRSVGSSHVDPFSAVSAGIAALYGPLHGGANEAVLTMLDEIGDVKNVPAYIEGVKSGKGRLMGFGHRVYKSYDPRAKLIKTVADQVFEQTGLNPKLEIALELERIALEDDYFVSRKLYPNVDFYSGLIYQAMGYPTDYFTVLFALGRLPGWIAQWEEMLNDPEQKISRPRQTYIGYDEREFVPMRRAELCRGRRAGTSGWCPGAVAPAIQQRRGVSVAETVAELVGRELVGVVEVAQPQATGRAGRLSRRARELAHDRRVVARSVVRDDGREAELARHREHALDQGAIDAAAAVFGMHRRVRRSSIKRVPVELLAAVDGDDCGRRRATSQRSTSGCPPRARSNRRGASRSYSAGPRRKYSLRRKALAAERRLPGQPSRPASSPASLDAIAAGQWSDGALARLRAQAQPSLTAAGESGCGGTCPARAPARHRPSASRP